jgi:V/A-type H+-transporting ATPase subunit D|tara:strand:+ start:5936 stop:6604 length:669 start_codon:yes stop_codon:yes gene_type:complete
VLTISTDIRPTRLEYLRAKKKIKIAQKGLKLLKLKRQALILEFFNISKSSAELRGELNSELIKGYQSIRMAEMLDGEMRLENEAMKIPQLKKLLITPKNVMGVKIPRLEGGTREQSLTEYLLEIPVSISEAVKAFQEVHKIVLDVAEKETTLRKLLNEIEKTKRKANAIENVFIPRLEDSVKFILFRLGEIERETFAMLKTVKRKISEREEQAKKETEIIAK